MRCPVVVHSLGRVLGARSGVTRALARLMPGTPSRRASVQRVLCAVALLLLASCVGSATTSAIAAGILPETLKARPAAAETIEAHAWRSADIIQLREIVETAISEDGQRTAFILKQQFLESGETAFGLYLVEIARPGTARKLLESTFMADLSAQPGSARWSIRADMGIGVQLYDVSDSGVVEKIVTSPIVVPWGGAISFLEVPHRVGVLGYAWASDGTGLWYSEPRQRDEGDKGEGGILFNPRTMGVHNFILRPQLASGSELHYLQPSTGTDTTLSSVSDRESKWSSLIQFSTSGRNVVWCDDAKHIRYRTTATNSEGELETELWLYDVRSGSSKRYVPEYKALTEAKCELQGGLTVDVVSGKRHLIQHAVGGERLDHGVVNFSEVLAILKTEDTTEGRLTVLLVRYRERDAVAVLSSSGSVLELTVPGNGNLSQCAVAGNAAVAVCVLDGLAQPPELVEVALADMKLRSLLRPNSDCDRIPPLLVEHAVWTNRYGHSSDGYMTYPRGYVRGRSYPVIVISHGNDARNSFASPWLEWNFHVNVFAEHGYVVLSVNEAAASFAKRASMSPGEVLKEGVSAAQRDYALDAVATMEEALRSSVRAGVGDPAKTAIVGWSRGGEVVQFVMSQSKIFKVGVMGDGYWPAAAHWSEGTDAMSELTNALYGGSPYSSESSVLANYRGLAAAFRGRQFSGPLLMLFRAESAPAALELNRTLSDARVPSELVYFPDEGHVFWNPRDRAAVMNRTVEWLDYWLRGIRDPNSEREEQYSRWQRMARDWKRVSMSALTPRGR